MNRVLEESADRIALIAEECGFSGEEQMRAAFMRLLQIQPRDYRKRFGAAS
jgi:transcriptional regulator GlxA family with amidase domain